MKKDIIIAGVGGQGILSIASVIDLAALKSGLHIKQAEVHGMSQRGGAVQSHLRISSEPIFSDLIELGCSDLILSVEPLEALRYLPYLSKEGFLVSSVNPFKNIFEYPDMNEILTELNKINNLVLADAEKIAKDCGSIKVSNIVMLGSAFSFLGISQHIIEESIINLFGRKGEEVVEMNIKAFRKGMEVRKNSK